MVKYIYNWISLIETPDLILCNLINFRLFPYLKHYLLSWRRRRYNGQIQMFELDF